MHRLRVFLDTNVLIRYLSEGEPESLFSNSTLDRVTYVINPIVLQELLPGISQHEKHTRWETLVERLEVASIDASLLDNDAVRRLYKVRNQAVHSNNFLIMASAIVSECDYLLSYDRAILVANVETRYSVMTPDAFTKVLEASS